MTASSDAPLTSPLPPNGSPNGTTVPDFHPDETLQAGEGKQPSRKWLSRLALALLLAGLGVGLWRVFGGKEEAGMGGPMAVPVKTERLQEDALQDSSEFVGTLDSRAGVSLQPEADGRVVQIFVSSGDRVQAGDPIMQLSASRSQSDYNAALSNITAASAARDASEAQLRAALERQAQLEAELTLQVSDYDRTAQLVDQGALAQELLDEAVRDRAVAQAAISSAEQEIQALIASRDQAQATLAQANDNATATQQDLLDKTVTAPIAGIVGDIPVKLGDYVTAGNPLASITQNQNLDLEITVDISNGSRLRTGLPVELMLTGQDETIATGNITFVSPTIDSATQTILAKARFSTPTQPLQNDQRLNVRVIWDERPGILIPTTAISRLGGQTFVFVPGQPDPPADGEGLPQENAQGAPPAGGQDRPPPVVAKLKPVKLGDLQGNEYQVLEGLNAGDTVITSGLLNLRDGVPIEPEKASAASQEDEPAGQSSKESSSKPSSRPFSKAEPVESQPTESKNTDS